MKEKKKLSQQPEQEHSLYDQRHSLTKAVIGLDKKKKPAKDTSGKKRNETEKVTADLCIHAYMQIN